MRGKLAEYCIRSLNCYNRVLIDKTSFNFQATRQFGIHGYKSKNLQLLNRKSNTMANEIELVKDKIVLKVPQNEEVEMKELWANNTAVITYFRRFGCILCRQGAVELSKLAPVLKAHGIRLIGIGLEEFGVEEFIEGKFFTGELYVDRKGEQFKTLGFKKYNFCSIFYAMCERASRTVYQLGKENNVGGNLKGNGYQSGGTLIVKKGGTEVILFYQMQGIADHLENEEILAALGIDPCELQPTSDPIITQPHKTNKITACDDSQCKIGFAEDKKDK